MLEVSKNLDLNFVKQQLLSYGYEFGPLTEIEPITGDAGSRKYFRYKNSSASYIVMDARDSCSQEQFVILAKALTTSGIFVPEIYEYDLGAGFLLLEDIGSKSLASQLSKVTADQLNQQAIDIIIKMQAAANLKKCKLPVMDAHYIVQRNDIWQKWFLERHLELEVDKKMQQHIDIINTQFIAAFVNVEYSFVHVDYHPHNLFLAGDKGEDICVLDFQDAMFGPSIYDVVSLLQDRDLDWDYEKINTWIDYYYQQAVAAKILNNTSLKDLQKQFAIIGAQRHLKNLGVFTKLHYFHNKSNYLQYIDNLLNYLQVACNKYVELKSLQEFLNNYIMPNISKVTV